MVRKINESLDGGIGEYDIDEVHLVLDLIIKHSKYVDNNIETYEEIDDYIKFLNQGIKRLKDVKSGKYVNLNWNE